MRSDQMPGGYETDDDRLDRLAAIVKGARRHWENLRITNSPSDEVARVRLSMEIDKAAREYVDSERDLRAAVAAYDAQNKVRP